MTGAAEWVPRVASATRLGPRCSVILLLAGERGRPDLDLPARGDPCSPPRTPPFAQGPSPKAQKAWPPSQGDMKSAPLPEQMSEYEACLAEAQRLYRRLASARGEERAAAERDYARALKRAREMAARLSGAA